MALLNVSTPDPLPLRADESGTIRVGGTRVTLESVIADYERGRTPEEIVSDFDVLKLADVHRVIAYYLDHRADVSKYLQHQRDTFAKLRAEMEAKYPPKTTMSEIEARWEEKKRLRQQNEQS
jgi:uncharacterized protein (DUF433 family)